VALTAFDSRVPGIPRRICMVKLQALSSKASPTPASCACDLEIALWPLSLHSAHFYETATQASFSPIGSIGLHDWWRHRHGPVDYAPITLVGLGLNPSSLFSHRRAIHR
jgi:hypothetical protein